MKIFVASWFFPPATSSEGIVTYKLLRNSGHEYHVFSSLSRQWGYKSEMKVNQEENITSFTVDTDNIDTWVDWCVEEFCSRKEQENYDAIMTRSTPPESILVGKRIKEKYPEIKWIASLADPVANNPYELKAYIDENPTLSEEKKNEIKRVLRIGTDIELKRWEKRPEEGIRLLCKLKRWEDAVLEKADLIISPTDTQLRYLLGDRAWTDRMLPLAHSFDESFYPEKAESAGSKNVLTFLGYSDQNRSLMPLVRAVKRLKESGSEALENLDIRIIGNNPREIHDAVLNYYLSDYISFEGNVSYYRSLEIMKSSDWLIHVDAFFKDLEPGGSIFFAGKLADYMGAGSPILAITGEQSPAYRIVEKYGGACCEAKDIQQLADLLEKIGEGYRPQINLNYRARYNAAHVAKIFDQRVKDLVGKDYVLRRSTWPQVEKSEENKILSICVPSYNVERYLDRCLSTLISHPMAPYLDIIVVDDGSKDHTAQIGREYESRYPGIIRLISKENGGHGSTINRAIQEAKGKYFRTVDADDWVDSDQLADLLQYIVDEQIDADVISSNYHEINIETAVRTEVKQGFPVEFRKIYTFDQIDPEKTYLTLASMQIKTEILRKMKVTLQEHTFYVDVEFILFPVPYINTMVFTEHFIYKYARGNAEQSVALPNMVKRYDHHNRVMRRVLAYEKKVAMNPGQHRYYDEIIKRLLCTHYFLGLVYDEDKERGCARTKEFDAYLKAVRPDLVKWTEKKMMIVKVARQNGFDAEKIDHSVRLAVKRCGEKALNELYGFGKATVVNNLTKKIVYNQFTLSVAQSDFFTNGAGKAVKDKVNTIFGM